MDNAITRLGKGSHNEVETCSSILFWWCFGTLDGCWCPFSSQATFEAIAPCFPRRRWANILWNKYSQKRCSFVTWLACQNRLYTRDRLKLRNITHEGICPLCGMTNESVEHIFFVCAFSNKVWNGVCDFNGLKLPNQWNMLWSSHVSRWRKDTFSLRWLCFALLNAIYDGHASNVCSKVYSRQPNLIKKIIYELKIKFASIERVKFQHDVIVWYMKIGIQPTVVRRIRRG